MSLWVYQQEQRQNQASLDSRAKARAVALDRGMDGAVDVVRDINQLFVANSGNVSRQQFHLFAQPLLARYPYIEALSFRRMLSNEARPAFESHMRSAYPAFTISDLIDGKRVPAPVKEHYCVIDYIEPVIRGDIRLGLDVLPRPEHREAMLQAADTGVPTGMGLSRLFSENGGDGFPILMAVYKNGALPPVASSRRETVVGYTIAVLRPAKLIEEVFDEAAGSLGNADLDMRVYASGLADKHQLAFRSANTASWPQVGLNTSWFNNTLKPFTYTFDVAGSVWHVVIAAQPTPFVVAHNNALIALLLGLLITAAATAAMRSVSLRAKRIELLVAQRTEELRQVNDLLTKDIIARVQAEDALRKLAAHQERVKEDERKRIARDIHDDLGQNLLALRIDLCMMSVYPDSSARIKEQVRTSLSQIDTTIQSVREIINDLRPSVLDLGLSAAVEWQVKQFARRSGILCEWDIDPDIDDAGFELDERTAITLFRIVQESLSNIMRHAHASTVRIRMALEDGHLRLKISDNGIGLPSDLREKTDAFGLAGIEERIHALGGKFSIESSPGLGMTLTLSVPLQRPHERQETEDPKRGAGEINVL